MKTEITKQLDKLSNKQLVTLFFNLNIADNMATNEPSLFMEFAKQFFSRKINLADYK
tara:strand:- start:547 stop:717 length:171 start_codon:yes stop_codon:yes gene_type:complete